MSTSTAFAADPIASSKIAIDARQSITSASLEKSGPDSWVTPVQRPPFPFDELIYSWDVRLPEEQGFRVYLKAGFPEEKETDWLYAGFWGEVGDLTTSRSKPVFDEGLLDMDWLRLKVKADWYQFKVERASSSSLTALPSFNVVTTDNKPTAEVAEKFRDSTETSQAKSRILDLPFRRQMNSAGELTPSRCQSAALATAMQFYGTTVPLEQIVSFIYDPEYEYPGLWPRIIAAAGEFGFHGYIDRFRDWDRVRAALAENKVILCSIRMPRGSCKEPPYESMGNHIVALNGVTDDGRVVVTDSYLAKSGRGYRCQWLVEDFEKIWMDIKNGVAMVICPPEGTEIRELTDLPEFPYGREPVTEDDH